MGAERQKEGLENIERGKKGGGGETERRAGCFLNCKHSEKTKPPPGNRFYIQLVRGDSPLYRVEDQGAPQNLPKRELR